MALRVVMSGGPCSGKTSTIRQLKDALTKRGYAVYTVPEAASELLSEGYSFERAPLDFQRRVLERQLQNEERVLNEIPDTHSESAIMLMDRGVFDAAVYIAHLEFLGLLFEKNLSEKDILTRYDYTFQLESLASVGEYSKAGNELRYEDPETACELDRKFTKIFKEVYPPERLFYIPVCSSLEAKIDLILQHLLPLLPLSNSSL